MEYPNVKNAHIVPRTYLANWAIDGKIAVWLVPENRRLHDQPVENVGTRRRFYERVRPVSGEKINDIEAMLGVGEAKATPLLRPSARDGRCHRNRRFSSPNSSGYQLLRGPRWKAEYEERTQRFLEDYDERSNAELPAEALDEQGAMLMSDSYRLISMFSTALTTATVLGSMHWTLVEFASPLVATSDHPVVLWPGIDSSAPRPVEIAEVGIMECLEIRLPLSPQHGVLMTWSDRADDDCVRIRGTRGRADVYCRCQSSPSTATTPFELRLLSAAAKSRRL